MILQNTLCKWFVYASLLTLTACVTTDEPIENNAINQSASGSSQLMLTKIPVRGQSQYAIEINDRLTAEPSEKVAIPDNLWLVMRDQFTLEIPDNARIQTQQNWFLKNPSYIQRVNQRAKPYLYFIKQQLEQNELPLEFALLPIVESAYEPFAYSHGRAAGLWQFVPYTAKSFGMDINWWYDGRRDVHASTLGAMAFLKYLHKRFNGNWLHALAAYNSGEGRVRKEIRKNKERGLPTDFWHLHLPKETRDYVPKLLALADLLNTAEEQAFEWPHIDNQAYLTQVSIGSQLDLSVAAQLAGLTLQQLHKLNPGFNRWATDPDGHYWLFLPIESQAMFSQGLDMLPAKERVQWKRHKVTTGDSLGKLANDYHTTKQVIKDVNQMTSDIIVAGKHLLIPVAKKSLNHYSLSQQQRLSKTQNRTRAQNKLTHYVKSGDTLWDLSRQYKVSLAGLAKWNQLAPKDPIRPGMKLVIWKDDVGKKNSDSIVRKLTYTVKPGDSLSRIASKFKLTINDILKWNPVNTNRYLKPGQQLKLFVDVTRT